MDDISSERTVESKSRQRIYRKSGLPTLLLRILALRGLEKDTDIEKFLDPSLDDLHDPFLLPNISLAADKVCKALKTKKKILVFGDYDTDGIISSFLMSGFLGHLGADVKTYIPNRFDEGYDISIDFVKKEIIKKEYGMLICVDCGTNSHQVRDFFLNNETKTDVIICDHHKPSLDYIPTDRYIIINPWLKDSDYPFKDLSGAAVTFKFINAVLKSMRAEQKKIFRKDYLTKLMDLVAITIISDVMPLIDENRVIVSKGLKILKDTQNEGIREILKNNTDGKRALNVFDIAFILSPRLNASGRLENAKTSLDLLNCKTDQTKIIAQKIERLNKKRQKIQSEIIEEIVCENDFGAIAKDKKIFIERSSQWHEGVLGIVASNLSKKYNIPVILFKQEKDTLKGSVVLKR